MNEPVKATNTSTAVSPVQHATSEQIRQRFDNDVDRFSSLETGQAAAMDSPLCTGLIAQAAAALTPDATHVLDVGCGAGNYTLTLLGHLNRRNVQCDLLDLSRPMLDRAVLRVEDVVDLEPATIQGDVREVLLKAGRYDVILASAVLHHLRTDQEWDAVFGRLFEALKPGGTLWIYDLVTYDDPAVEAMMRQRHATYLEDLGGEAYRDKVLAYMKQEDTPRSLADQTMRMEKAGFDRAIILHVNACFAAFGAQRPRKCS